MGSKCRIQNITPPCSYNVEGIAHIWLLDFDDFTDYVYEGEDLYSNCFVTDILRIADFVELETPDKVAKYSSSGNYNHNLETFVSALKATTLSNLHLAINRRYIVLFEANNGQFFTFGYEVGAKLSYTNKTNEGFGSLISITCASKYPLFEVSPDIFARPWYKIKYVPDFENGAYCEKTILPDWVLEYGAWNTSGKWYNKGVWKNG